MPSPAPDTTVLAVHRDREHRFGKCRVGAIELQAGLGVVDDAHWGRKVQHRSRVKADPEQPNLRQVHLISAALFAHLETLGFAVGPGQLGENISLADAPGLGWRELIALPTGTRLHFAQGPVVELTGLRNPCAQIDHFQPGLLAAMLERMADGRLIRKTGVMGVVLQGGRIQPHDALRLELPPAPQRVLERV
ncbi:MOSC domain-containing protein [Comamonas guangdongensis]|uniref:MOSC domain-containing protein n=1 Tax=Comamonas guangdongensis TaxID=510515 RepID=A0ABV3ZXM9_9BURK